MAHHDHMGKDYSTYINTHQVSNEYYTTNQSIAIAQSQTQQNNFY